MWGFGGGWERVGEKGERKTVCEWVERYLTKNGEERKVNRLTGRFFNIFNGLILMKMDYFWIIVDLSVFIFVVAFL